MGYAVTAVQGLEACPFCREMFPRGEARECPMCGVRLVSAARLAPAEAGVDEDEQAAGPKQRGEATLPWTYLRLGRGPLLILGLLGLVAFGLPWVNSFSPERVVYSGVDLARRTGVAWSVGVAWFTLVPLVLSRRTPWKLRGARLACAFLSIIPGMVALMLLLHPPQSAEAHGVVLRVRYAFEPAIYLTAALSLAATVVSALFLGGRAPKPDAPARG